MIERKTWEEFRDCKLLWWVNRLLHTFGWAIVVNIKKSGKIGEVYPARVKFRGFDEKNETEGFIGLTQHLQQNVDELVAETKE